MKITTYIISIIFISSLAFTNVYAQKNWNSSKSNTSTSIRAAERDIVTLLEKTKREIVQMTSEMVKLEDARSGKFRVEVSVSVKLIPIVKKR
ncbi:MAG: hypothetical protein HN353_08990 [Bdellovibrionales bacterium]|mgnify:CR=1 FL=1|jgi:hypothetical protein|nr:hypothetical protein [Bdellovibrionales bacterium]MBT3525713.1 hypothetical protein [Bdellovibrionales bacterium]MBT7669258.1 hypothetical protein [Bdellovibrionales bacterium]